MTWSTVCVYPSFTTRWAMLFLFAFPFFVWVLAVNRREGSGPMSAVISAGIAEAIGMITFGSLIAAIVASLSWLRDRIARVPAPRRPATKRTVLAAVISFAVCVAILVAEVFVADGIAEFSPITLYTAAVVSALGAVASLIWLIASRRVPTLQIDKARGAVAGCCAAASVLLCYASWRIAHAYMAMHG